METATRILPAFAARPAESSASRDAALAALVDDYLARLQAGDEVDPDAFAAEHPEHAERLGRLLPALELMDDMRRSSSSLGQNHSLTPLLMESPGIAPGLVGDFQIVREVGRGGMGVVYEARQLSLDRRVALKVLPLAAAMDPRQLGRFHVEAQAAACLHHTNIVPIHAVGCERGVHFYAMQFIDGQTLAAIIGELRELDGVRPSGDKPASTTLSTWLVNGELAPETPGPRAAVMPPARVPLDPPARPSSPSAFAAKTASESLSSTSTHSRAYARSAARLGIQAAEAIEHAHGLGVVHRDIKPANLLVDDRGNLWITDFGLARLQNDSGLTLTGDLMGTLRYMSPEQATGRGVDVDHRTDIYSLGVTLYELLTLHTACPGDDRQTVLRQVAEEEPISLRRHNPAIPRELETIVLKAIAKDPGSRYTAAQELADDLRRYLDNKPIKAKPPTVWEHAAKWSRRHKPVVASAVGVLVLAVVSLAISTAAISRERDEALRQRRRAEENFARAHQAVNDYLTKVSEERLLDQPGMQPLRKELLEAALKYYRGFLQQYVDDPALQAEVADTSLRVGRVIEMIGLKPDALASYQAALTHYRNLAQALPGLTEMQDGMATSLIQVGDLQYRTGDTTSAMTSFREAIATLDRLVQSKPEIHRFQEGLAKSHHLLGDLQFHFNAFEDARKSYLRAIELWERLAAADPDLAGYQSGLALSLTLLGWNSLPSEAQLHHERAHEIYRRLVAAHPAETEYQHRLAGSYTNLGNLHFEAGRLEAAEPLYQLALDVYRRLAPANPSVRKYRLSVAIRQDSLGMLRLATGDVDVARQLFHDSISITTQLVAADPKVATNHAKLIDMYINLGILEQIACDFESARRAYQRAHEVATRLVAADPSARHQGKLAQTFIRLGHLHLAEGDYEAARGCFQPDLALKTIPNEACLAIVSESPETQLGVGNLERNNGDWRAAAQSYERAIAIWAREYEARPTETAARHNLARAYLELGRLKRATDDPSGARLVYEQARALREKLAKDSPTHFPFARDLGLTYIALGHFCHDHGQPEDARGWYEKAAITYRGFLRRKPDNPVMCHELAWLLATCPDPRFRDPAQAIVLAKTAVDRSPGVGTFAATLGLAHYRAGHWDEAIEALEKATQLRASGDPSVWFFLAMAHWQEGEKDQARQWYDKAVDTMEKNHSQDDELRRFRAEGAALLGLDDQPKRAGRKEANATRQSKP